MGRQTFYAKVDNCILELFYMYMYVHSLAAAIIRALKALQERLHSLELAGIRAAENFKSLSSHTKQHTISTENTSQPKFPHPLQQSLQPSLPGT